MCIRDSFATNSEIVLSSTWKYVDDSTISELVAKTQSSSIQSAVDVFDKNVSSDNFQLNEGKCKELRINFSTKTDDKLHPIKINEKQIGTAPQAKILSFCFKSFKMELPTLMK